MVMGLVIRPSHRATASISTDKQSGSTPLVVNFDAGNSIAGNDQNNIQSYLWDFGDSVQEPYRKTQRRSMRQLVPTGSLQLKITMAFSIPSIYPLRFRTG